MLHQQQQQQQRSTNIVRDFSAITVALRIIMIAKSVAAIMIAATTDVEITVAVTAKSTTTHASII